METDNRLKLRGVICNYTVWDDTINDFVNQFYSRYNVYPNIFLANEFTYRRIDMFAQKHPDRIIDPEGENTLETSSIPYNGISVFATESYSLEMCFDFDLTDGSFMLIFDEAPDFDGEPEPVPEEKEEGKKPYLYTKSA
jgi:hypothetical protein